MAKNPKYSIKERYDYHSGRYYSCARYGIKFGSPKHCYSTGFRDAFAGRDNADPISREFGKTSGSAYKLGYKRGQSAAKKYFLTTGKQPSNISRE